MKHVTTTMAIHKSSRWENFSELYSFLKERGVGRHSSSSGTGGGVAFLCGWSAEVERHPPFPPPPLKKKERLKL